MLHILWLIIKFILIALGIVLGLLLLAILLVLFCPVRYQASGMKEKSGWKEAEASARISWLFRIISVSFTYRDGNMGMGILIFGIPLEAFRRFLEKLTSFKKPERSGKPGHSRKKGLPEKSADPSDVKRSNGTAKQDKERTVRENGSKPEPPTPPEQKAQKETSGQRQQTSHENPVVLQKPDDPDVMQEDSGKPGLFQQIWDKIKKILHIPVSLLKKAAALPGKVIEKLRKIRLTLRRIYDKIDWWKEFFFHPRTKAAISLVWQNAKGLVRHVMPVKTEGHVTFGSEDPAITGAVLAVMGMTFPFHKNRIELNPLFDGENQLTGNIKLKGRIYGFVFLKAAIVIYFNKNIKYVISRWKHKED
ncbi:DUF2953 domain-containing protein [Ruminococcus sp. 5_1_39BFAA]|uniref:DUF2953 domain-containing protein n=1 Tax=Ruminococcus sp. 5_1_39BFAA TaxID=457412 RepID=UPI00356845B6